MRLAPIALALAAILVLTSCADSDEDVPTTAPATSQSSSGDIVFCPRIGDGSNPVTTTPIPSCSPGPHLEDLSDASLQEADAPPLPGGFTAHSPYYIVEGGAAGLPAQLAVTLTDDEVPFEKLAWYTYIGSDWQRLAPIVEPIGPVEYPAAIGTFDELPSNLIVLAEP